MRLIDTTILDVKILEPRVFSDARGFFMESFNQKQITELLGSAASFVQDNHSHSSKGVLRGLHYQLKNPQGKLVRVVQGEAFDVVVDLRKSSKTFGRWFGLHLSQENKKMLWVPPGFAHGFLALSPTVDFLYKTTNYYDPSSEYTLIWNDRELGIEWPAIESIKLSDKDLKGLSLKQVPLFP